jgi:hypothetical protein
MCAAPTSPDHVWVQSGEHRLMLELGAPTNLR